MKDIRISLSLKKVTLLVIWFSIFFKINFGVIRGTFFLTLLENNQILLNLIMIFLVYLLCKQELNQSLKELNISMLKKVGAILAILLLINYIYMSSVFGSFEVSPQRYDFTMLVASIAIAPLKEELIYRYLFLGMTNSKWSKLILGIVSALLFFYAHRFAYGGNILAMIQVLFLTVGTTYLYLKTKNIFSAVLLHSFYNLFIIIISLI
ncbi:CPBP family intramembrane metalloprotease [Enterococcus hirae]|nr:CPBP family intramembrane metalloprotease [Enterococcus hirae]